eukprot:12938055-Prorocentrum_lima.AAC.1
MAKQNDGMEETLAALPVMFGDQEIPHAAASAAISKESGKGTATAPRPRPVPSGRGRVAPC